MRHLKISQNSWSKRTWTSHIKVTILYRSAKTKICKRSGWRRPTGKGVCSREVSRECSTGEGQMLRPRDVKVWSTNLTIRTFVILGV